MGSPQLGHTVKTNYGTSDCSAIDILSFDFSEKGLRLVFLTHFAHEFSRKTFVILYSID